MEKVEIGELKEIDAKEVKYLFHKSGNPIEEALMIQDLMRDRTQQEVAKILEISQPQISKRLRLLHLHPILQERLKNGNLRPSTAYVLSKLPTQVQRLYLNQEKVTLREVEAKRRQQAISKEVMEILEKNVQFQDSKTFDPISDALKILSTGNVQLDFGWTDEGIKFWRFLFGKEKNPLVCVFEDGTVLVDVTAKMSKTRRNYHFNLSLPKKEMVKI